MMLQVNVPFRELNEKNTKFKMFLDLKNIEIIPFFNLPVLSEKMH